MKLRQIPLLGLLVSLISAFALSSQVWASALISDSQLPVSATGLDSYPQISIVLLTWVVLLFVSRYVNSFFGKFLLSSVLVMMMATTLPIFFGAASMNLSILQTRVASATGIAGWAEQEVLLSDTTFNSVAAEGFCLALVFCFAFSIWLVWSRTERGTNKSLETRIDRLPQW